jgi:hypothetical protein
MTKQEKLISQAVKIIEQVIEPLLGRGIEGEEYYQIEDAIIAILK